MRGDAVTNMVLAGAAGAGTAFVFWMLFRFAIDRQVSQTIEREVPPRVRVELDSKLRSIGLTPEVGAAISRLSAELERGGVWSALARA